MQFALTSVCVNGQGESERDVTDKIVNVGVPRSTQRLKSGAINGRDSVSESRRAVLSLLVALCWAELTRRRPGATHADVNANCLHVGEVAQMLSHLPCDKYMSERPFLQHPFPMQHLPPIKRAIARLLPLPTWAFAAMKWTLISSSSTRLRFSTRPRFRMSRRRRAVNGHERRRRECAAVRKARGKGTRKH